MKTHRVASLFLVLPGILPAIGQAQGNEPSAWRAEASAFSGWGGPGTRTGDVQGYGLAARYSWSARWSQSFGVDLMQYDLETPAFATGVEPRHGDEPVDPFTTVVRVQSEFEYRFREVRSGWDPYAAFGAGVYFIDVPDVSGNTEGGGTFQLQTESPTTPGITARLGGDWILGERFSIGVCASYSQTFRKYVVTDTESGQSGEVDPFAPLGLSIRFAYQL